MEKLEKNLEKEPLNRLRYPQPYHIKIDVYNEALNSHLRQKEHGRMKYLAHKKSKKI